MDSQINTDLLTDAGIPPAYWALTRDTYWGSKKALAAVENYIVEAPRAVKTGMGLFITGDRDTLKTYLLVHVLMNLMVKGYDVRFHTIEELSDQYWKRDESKASLEQSLAAPMFLAVDRVNEPENQGTQTVLKRLVSIRKDAGRPLLLASCLDQETFDTTYTGRISDFVRMSCLTVHAKVNTERREDFYTKRKMLMGSSQQEHSEPKRW